MTDSGQVLAGSPATPKEIKVYALFGKFRIEGSNFVIRYACCYANGVESPSSDLLEELRPVRDRLDPSHLNDLGSLLQRDLNDARVAQELIPYLRGERSPIGFFPAILAVLVPKGYLEGNSHDSSEVGANYPSPERLDDQRVKYGQCWTMQEFQLGEEIVPLGTLSIFPNKSEIIVLDGQHRGTAFRYLSGHFDPEDEIYQTFYDGVDRPESFAADLPVTLIWFESDAGEDIDPKLISRQLFVDVNNSAKPVSRARTLLLDDRAVTSVATQSVYNFAAKRGFSPDEFSLLHSAYDKDSDLAAGQRQSLSITEPEIVEDMFEWALFGSDRYGSLGTWEVRRRHEQTNTGRFLSIFESMEGIEQGGDDEDSPTFYFVSPERARSFRDEVTAKYLPVISSLYDELAFLRPHYVAAEKVTSWATSGADTTQREVWKRVFCGGEGLYWTFQRVQETDRSRNYLQAIEKIESKFRSWRAEEYGAEQSAVDRVYESFVTKAFQSGYVMAVEYLAREGIGGGEHEVAARRLIERLNGFSMNRWRALFRDVRKIIIPGDAHPKVWPTYRDMLVRMYDNDDTLELFSEDEMQCLPEWKALSKLVEEKAKAIVSMEHEEPEKKRREGNVDDMIGKVSEAFGNAGLETRWIESSDMRRDANELFSEIVASELEKLERRRERE